MAKWIWRVTVGSRIPKRWVYVTFIHTIPYLYYTFNPLVVDAVFVDDTSISISFLSFSIFNTAIYYHIIIIVHWYRWLPPRRIRRRYCLFFGNDGISSEYGSPAWWTPASWYGEFGRWCSDDGRHWAKFGNSCWHDIRSFRCSWWRLYLSMLGQWTRYVQYMQHATTTKLLESVVSLKCMERVVGWSRIYMQMNEYCR